MKKCTKCERVLEESEFAFRVKSRGSRRAWCRACVKEWDAQAYRDGRKFGATPEQNKALRKRNQDWLLAFLKEHPCVDCGITDIRVLELDHIRDKESDVSTMMSGYSLNKIKEEVLKCEVRCANCHRIVTCMRAKSWRHLATV